MGNMVLDRSQGLFAVFSRIRSPFQANMRRSANHSPSRLHRKCARFQILQTQGKIITVLKEEPKLRHRLRADASSDVAIFAGGGKGALYSAGFFGLKGTSSGGSS